MWYYRSNGENTSKYLWRAKQFFNDLVQARIQKIFKGRECWIEVNIACLSSSLACINTQIKIKICYNDLSLSLSLLSFFLFVLQWLSFITIFLISKIFLWTCQGSCTCDNVSCAQTDNMYAERGPQVTCK